MWEPEAALGDRSVEIESREAIVAVADDRNQLELERVPKDAVARSGLRGTMKVETQLGNTAKRLVTQGSRA